MAKARKEQINLDITPYYHLMSRCVRRTFLCGIDSETGKDYSHRKQWIVNRIKYLSKIYAMNIAAYAVLSNHYHLVLHVNRSLVDTLSDKDVFERGKLLFPKKAKELEFKTTLNTDHPEFSKTIQEWRSRLSDISWFMKSMNEPIARISNAEDDCKGHFWEGRYKSQALLDEGAVLSAMAYVDLNPIRAGIAESPEDSEFTSIKERIDQYKRHQHIPSNPQPEALMPLQDDGLQKSDMPVVSFKIRDYFKLVDETGRRIRKGKQQGSIPKDLEPILSRINLNPNSWLNITNHLESLYAFIVGCEDKLVNFAKYLRPPKGVTFSRVVYTG